VPNGANTFYDAFAGIGGFRLGLERAGFTCVGGCEIDDYARQVYHKNFGEWPARDIREVTDINGADRLCGGFPCQDISVAGKGAGLSGERSGLWWELARLIKDCAPRIVFLENVPALTHRGLGDVLGALADGGYDAEWDCIPAAAFGAPHRRDRVWIVANSEGVKGRDKRNNSPDGKGWKGRNEPRQICTDVADAKGIYAQRLDNRQGEGEPWRGSWWEVEPSVGRVANGVPSRMDRLRCLGNAVVPQVVEWIGRRINREDHHGI